MYKKNIMAKTTARVNTTVEGETIEMKVERMLNNGEPITDGAPIIHTERKDGVLPGYDIRTDRFEVAIDAVDKIAKTHKAKREEFHKPKIVKMDGSEGSGGASGEAGGEIK